MTKTEHIEEMHGNLAGVANDYLPSAMTISLVSVNDREGGQLILHDPEYDKKVVASRLRLAADILSK